MYQRLIGYLLASISMMAFASTFICGSVLTKHEGISPSVLAFLRFLIAGSVMLIWEIRTTEKRKRLFYTPSKRDWMLLIWLGPVGTSIMAWCVFMGCTRVSTANASMADALAPLLIFGLGVYQTRHITRLQICGVLSGFLGALLVIGIINQHGIALSAYSTGDFYIFLAAATWAIYSVFGRATINRIGSGPFTVWTMVFGTLSIGMPLIFADMLSADKIIWPTTLHSWGLVCILGIVCTLVPFWTWNAAQKYLSISTLGMTAYFTPVAATIFAVLFLNEKTTCLQWIGVLFTCLSAVVEQHNTQNQHAPEI